LREKCWQRERLHHWYTSMRHPSTRRWGIHSDYNRAWTFTQWQHSGHLDSLISDDARVRQWVRAEPLRELWDQATRNPSQAGPILTLATLETALRCFDKLDRSLPLPAHELVRFRRIQAGAPTTADKNAPVTIGG